MRAYLVAGAMLLAVAGDAAAQGRVIGVVRDERGDPIKGATIIAENADASPNSFTSSSDERGRFALIGLKSGVWSFRAGAPGYAADGGDLNVRAGQNTPLSFTLQKLLMPPSALGSLSPKDLQEALARADELYDKQQWDAAISEYRDILERSPSLSVIHLQIAAAYRGKKAFDDAIAAYNELLKKEPANDKAKVGIAMTSLEKGDVETAERTLESAAQAPGATREVFYDLGEVKRARSLPDEAAKAYAKAAEADPTWGKPQLALGRIAMDKGDAATARKHFQMVTEVDPVSPEAAQATTMLRQLDQGR
ncbi:MAG TPA: tetratricopeptide repeat protein [Vicinamibacterales bacterium]|jgi:tetratricopeptide (TPR) repeat protein|nr:tetratricopeptide repeat protein [Vicinamibacterales bacterium]